MVCAAVGWYWSTLHESIMNPWLERTIAAPTDEILILSMTVASFMALSLAVLNRVGGLGLLSKLAEQVTFVLIPPLVLIFLVLGTIFLGVATPTEGGAMGAMGALIMAVSRRRLNFSLLKQALDGTAKLATFVMFILIGSTVFSFTFNAADGHIWVENLFVNMPGGALGFLIVVNILVFILGCFIDFFEIAFIVVPILAPVAEKILPAMVPDVPAEAVMIWFGVVLAMNLQTSFLTPPFGFALFYLRSVAAKKDYHDRITGQLIPAVTTAQIYKGSIAFIVLQLVMVAAVIAFPSLVTGSIGQGEKLDADQVLRQMQEEAVQQEPVAAAQGGSSGPASSEEAEKEGENAPPADDDPMKALQESMKADANRVKK